MDTLIHVLETALPVFLTLGLGVLCRRTKLLSPEGVKALKSVAVNITLPAVMFSAFATGAPLSPSYKANVEPLKVTARCFHSLVARDPSRRCTPESTVLPSNSA